MKKKKWEEFSNNEKIILLEYWWYMYGGSKITPRDWDKFNNVVEKYPDEIFKAAVYNYMYDLRTNLLMQYIRDNTIDYLIDNLKDKTIEDREFYRAMEDVLIETLVNGYNSDIIPLEEETMLEDIKKIK